MDGDFKKKCALIQTYYYILKKMGIIGVKISKLESYF